MDILTMFKDSENIKDVSKGSYIFHQNQEGDFMYVILEGEVDIELNDVVIATFKPGHLFGEMALIDDKPRSASAFAKTDCKLVPVDKESLIYLIQQAPHFAIFMMKVLINKVRKLDKILAEVYKPSND